MTAVAPDFRAVEQHTGEIAEGAPPLPPTADEMNALRADLAKVTEQRDEARAEVDNLTLWLKDSGSHVANLSSGLAMYQAERDDYRERADEYCDMHSEAQTRIQELEAELEQVKRELARERGQ